MSATPKPRGTAGRIAVVAILGIALIGGALMFYLQVWGYYRDVTLGRGALNEGLTLIAVETEGGRVELDPQQFEAIAADSSPIRFRACFTLDDPDALVEAAAPMPEAVPLVAPFWFECFDAPRIGADISAGRAVPVMLEPDYLTGIDRVAAVYPDGRVYAWQQINDQIAPNRRID